MAGRKFLYLTAILLTLAGLNALLPPALAWLRKDGPSFGLHDMRAPSYLPPYDPRPEPSGVVMRYYTIHGPALTLRYRKGIQLRSLYDEEAPPPLAVFQADATDEITLPDGERLRLAALQFLPQPQQGTSARLPVEEVFYHPSGRWMTKEEGVEINRHLNHFGDVETVRNSQSMYGLPWSVHIGVQMDLVPEDIEYHGVRDTKTGGIVGSGGVGVSDTVLPEPHDGLDRIVWVIARMSAVRPTPVALHLKIRQGDVQVIKLEPHAPQSFIWEGKEYSLQTITTGTSTGAEVVYSGEPIPPGVASISASPGEHKLTFDTLPEAVTGIHPYNKEGKRMHNRGRANFEYVFDGPAQEISRIEIRTRPAYANVVFKLPEIPVIPESNREIQDLMAMRLPPMTVRSDDHLGQLIGSVLQGGYHQQSLSPETTLGYPLDIGGITVGELLSMDHRRFPPHEVVVSQGGHHTSIVRKSQGATLSQHYPRLALALNLLGNNKLVILLVVGGLALMKGVSILRASSLRKSLRPRGYRDLSLWDAEKLYWELGSLAWKMPPRDELATIPEVDVEDLPSLIAFLQRGYFERRERTQQS